MNISLPVIIGIGKITASALRFLGLGAGATWPGEISLILRPQIAPSLFQELKKGAVIVAGTNGKTTTALMIKKILEAQGLSVVHNASGANLLNGVVSAFIQCARWNGKVEADWGVFEVDENSLPLVISNYPISQLTNKKQKLIIVLLNLFRDQLDRYGEVDVIVEKWEKALLTLSKDTTVILNSDDPGIASLGKAVKGKVMYFGLNEPAKYLKTQEHATDSTFCSNCGQRLTYDGVYYAHIGVWSCLRCGNKRPKPTINTWPSPLPGLYNQYNTLAAVATAKALGIAKNAIKNSLSNFPPAFGRQEEFAVDGKKIKIFLSKNPAGFNASLRTALEMGAKDLLLVLNDRIPDGRDVSWIWDVDFEVLAHDERKIKERDEHKIFVSGDRCYDLALRMKYAGIAQSSELGARSLEVEPNLKRAVLLALSQTTQGKTLFVLSTYTAMLEIRKILIGRKIL